jgi:hypothetical protein
MVVLRDVRSEADLHVRPVERSNRSGDLGVAISLDGVQEKLVDCSVAKGLHTWLYEFTVETRIHLPDGGFEECSEESLGNWIAIEGCCDEPLLPIIFKRINEPAPIRIIGALEISACCSNSFVPPSRIKLSSEMMPFCLHGGLRPVKRSLA